MDRNYLSELVGSFAMPAAENPTFAIMEAGFPSSRPGLAIP